MRGGSRGDIGMKESGVLSFFDGEHFYQRRLNCSQEERSTGHNLLLDETLKGKQITDGIEMYTQALKVASASSGRLLLASTCIAGPRLPTVLRDISATCPAALFCVRWPSGFLVTNPALLCRRDCR